MFNIFEIVDQIPFPFLIVAPFCAVAVLYFLSVFSVHKRRFLWLLTLTEIASFTLIILHFDGGLVSAFTHFGLLTFLTVLLSPVLFVKTVKEKLKASHKTHLTQELLPIPEDASVVCATPAPMAVMEEESLPMPENNTVKSDVQLAHVFQVLKKLQSLKLSAGDRLESDVIERMLNVYQAKATLSAEETRTLNNYLATLLKLMSKYSV